MENEAPLFCTQCGATLNESATFCQECGTPVSGTVASGTPDHQNKKGNDNNKGKIILVTGMLVVLAGFSLYFGAMMLMDAVAIANEVMNDPASAQVMIDYGITYDMLLSSVETAGYLMIAVGVLALVDAALTFTKRFWAVAFVLTIILTVLMFWTLIGLVLGIIAIYFQYTAKSEFA
jgi:predicted cobalt transporter CbtA